MPDESDDVTIQAADYSAETYTGTTTSDITPQEPRASRVKKELEAEIAVIEAQKREEAAERAKLLEDRYWKGKIEPLEERITPDLSFLETEAVTMGPPQAGTVDIGAAAVGERIAEVLKWVGTEREWITQQKAGRLSSMAATNAIRAVGAYAEAIRTEASTEKAKSEYDTAYKQEELARKVVEANRYGVSVDEVGKPYMGDWAGGPAGSLFYPGAQGPPTGAVPEMAPSGDWGWQLRTEPIPEEPVQQDVEALSSYLQSINPEGKGKEFDVRKAALQDQGGVKKYKDRIRKKLKEGEYPEEYRNAVEEYLTAAETYEGRLFQWAATPSKQAYWAARIEKQNPDLPPSLAQLIAERASPFEGPPSPAALEMLKWATETNVMKTGEGPKGIRGDLLPASYPQFVKEAGEATGGEGGKHLEKGLLQWANTFTDTSVEAKGEASLRAKATPSPTPPTWETEAAGVLGLETLPSREPGPELPMEKYTTMGLTENTMGALGWLKEKELGWVGAVNKGVDLLPEGRPEDVVFKSALKAFSTFGVGAVGGTAMAFTSLGLVPGAAEYFIRRPGEAFGNIIPGLGAQKEGLATAFEEDPFLTTGEVVGPLLLPYAVKRASPITVGLTEIGTGGEKVPTLWHRIGIPEKGFSIPVGREMIMGAEGPARWTGHLKWEPVTFSQERAPTSSYLYLMTKRPFSAEAEGGTVLAGIGRAKTAEGVTTTRPFIGHPSKGLMEASDISFRSGLETEGAGQPLTRGEVTIMDRFLREHVAEPEKLQWWEVSRATGRVQGERLHYQQENPLYSSEQVALTPEDRMALAKLHESQGRSQVQVGSKVLTDLAGEDAVRSTVTSDYDYDYVNLRAMGKSNREIRAHFEEAHGAQTGPAEPMRVEPSPGREDVAAAIIQDLESHRGEPGVHFKEVEAPGAAFKDTSKIIGMQEANPQVLGDTMFMETIAGGKARVGSPTYMLRSHLGRLFGDAAWSYKAGGTADISPVVGGKATNLADIWVESRYIARTAYEEPGRMIFDPLGRRTSRVRALGQQMEDFSTMIRSKYEAKAPESFAEIQRDVLRGVNRNTPGPAERLTTRVRDWTTAEAYPSDWYGAARGLTEYAGRHLPEGALGPGDTLPPAPRPIKATEEGAYPTRPAETYPPVMPGVGYQRSLWDYPPRKGGGPYPREPEYPRTPEPTYPRRGPGYQRSLETTYPREPTYPRGPETTYPREPTYPRGPETTYPRETEYPRPPPSTPRPRVPPPPPWITKIPGKDRTERHPRPLEVIGYGEVVHPIVTGKYFLGLEGRKALPRVREWHLTRYRGDVSRAPGLPGLLRTSRARAPYVQVRGKPRWTEAMTFGKVYKRAFWKKGPGV